MLLFIQGYLIIMQGEKEAVRTQMNGHLKDLMVDSELYVWEKVCAYHAVWLNQLEQGQMRSDDQEEKMRFLCALMWHLAISTIPAVHNSPTPLRSSSPRKIMATTYQ